MVHQILVEAAHQAAAHIVMQGLTTAVAVVDVAGISVTGVTLLIHVLHKFRVQVGFTTLVRVIFRPVLDVVSFSLIVEF